MSIRLWSDDFNLAGPEPRRWKRLWFRLRYWLPNRRWHRAQELGDCRVYWGSHGCEKIRGHRGHHWCDCTPRITKLVPYSLRLKWWGLVGLHPFYGPDTSFYGEDA